MDDRLRQLERVARANPDDLAAGRALVRALDQAGDGAGAWQARCRLARAGDDAAWAELWPLPAGARRAGDAVQRVVPGEQRVRADASTVLLFGERLEALDALTLEPRWWASEAQDVAALAGPWVLHAPAGERALVLRLAGSGEEVVRTALPGRARALHVSGDRVVVTVEQGGGTSALVVDLGDAPGAPLSLRPDLPPFDATGALVRGRRLVLEPDDFTWEVRDLEGDVPRWFTDDVPLHASDRAVVTGRVFVRSLRFAERDPVSGEARWTVQHEQLLRVISPFGALVTDDVVLLSAATGHQAGTPRQRLSALALDRRDGRARWTGPDVDVGPHVVHSHDVSRDVAYLAWAEAEGPFAGRLQVHALDLQDGRVLWAQPLGLRARQRQNTPVFAVDGGLVAADAVGGETVVVRLGAP